MFETLVPAQVVVVTATPEMYEAELHEEEAAAIQKAVEKRRREFAAGRAAARAALFRLGGQSVPIPAREDRMPQWPPGYVGSITHTGGYCAAAVARKREVLSVGIDVEQRGPLRPGTRDLICTERELSAIAGLPGTTIDWAKVTFSAKEAFYKCYYPLEETFLGFKDVELEIDPEAKTFTATVINREKPALNGLRVLQGNLQFDGQFVYASVALLP